MTVDLGFPGLSVSPGSHICAFYGGDSERDEIMIPFLREGIRNGDRCVCLVDRVDAETVLRALEADPSVKAGLESNRLELLSSLQSYLAIGRFDPDNMVGFWIRIFDDALAKGGALVRIIGEMSWSLRDFPGVNEFLVYESKFNQISHNYPQVTICMYDLKIFGGKLLIAILKTHPQVLVGNVVHENPYYMEPDEYLASQGDDHGG